MKNIFSALLALMLLALPLLAVAEDAPALAPASTTLTVLGSASVTLEPDMAQVSVGVNTQASTVAEASAANARAVDSLIAALKAAGVAQEDMATQHFNVNPQYDYQYSSIATSQKILGYQVSNTLRVTVRQLDALGSVLDAAMAAGANECYGVTFLSTQANEATDKAMALAVEDAQRKAGLMAAASGKELVRLVSLKEQGSSYVGMNTDTVLMTKAAGTTILSNGLDFSFTVEAVYEAQ